MRKKNVEKIFCFWHHSIWIGCVKFSVLRRGYLQSALNVLKNSLKILHFPKKDFFYANCLHINQ